MYDLTPFIFAKKIFRKIYSESLKGGGAVLYDAGFNNCALKSSVNSMTAQACKNIEATGTAYVTANIFKTNRNVFFRRTDNFLWRFNHITIDIDYLGDFAHNYQALEDDLFERICWHTESYGIAKELKLSISLVKRRRIEIKKSEGFAHWAAAQI